MSQSGFYETKFTLHGRVYPYHEERMSFYMRKATLYNEYEHVGQLDWLEFVDYVSCFSFNTQKSSLLNSLTMAVVEFWFIEIYF